MSKNTPEVYHQKMSTAFHTMIALPLAVFVYLFLERKHHDLQPLLDNEVIVHFINYGFTLLVAALTFLAYKNFKVGVSNIQSTSLREKFEGYTNLNLRAYLIIGLAFIILVGGLILTSAALFIVDYVLLLFLLSLQRPAPSKYIRDLALEGDDKTIVRDKLEFKN